MDVDAVFVADNVVSNLAFGAFTPYLNLPPAKYDLAVRAAGDNNVVAAFRADLSGLAGGAATVFASGQLAGAPAFGLFAALPGGQVIGLPLTPTARVQVIHNAPEPTVDVYAGNTRLLDNFAFRTATPFIDVPADREIALGVAGENSASAADALATFPVTLTAGETYTVMAAGIVGGTGATAFNLFVNAGAQESAADPAAVAVNVFHGSPDAPAVDVYEWLIEGKLIANLNFGQYTSYLNLPPGIYDLVIEQANSVSTFAPVYRADLENLAGQAATVFASGFYVGSNPAFGLFAALSDGSVIELPSTPFASVQIIHDAPAPTVDVYLNSKLIIDNFEFTDVFGFTGIPAERGIVVGIAPENSSSANDAIASFSYNLEEARSYIIAAAGIVGGSGPTAFNLFVDPDAKELSGSQNDVALQVFHGSPDAPEIDVVLPDGTILFDNLSFGDFSGYINVPSAVYEIRLTPANDNNTILATYRLDVVDNPNQLLLWRGRAFTIFASGFINTAPPFGLYVARTFMSIPLQQVSSTNQLTAAINDVQLFPNPNAGHFNLTFRVEQDLQLRYRIVNTAGRVVAEGDFDRTYTGTVNQRIVADNLPGGVYHLQLLSDKGMASYRFSINR